MFDVLIIGGGVAGMSCALILGSAHKKPFMSDKSFVPASKPVSNLKTIELIYSKEKGYLSKIKSRLGIEIVSDLSHSNLSLINGKVLSEG